LDPSIEISTPEMKTLSQEMGEPFFAYGFRGKNGKAVVAYWLAAHSVPGGYFPPLYGAMTLKNSGIERPVLIDIVSGKITALDWKNGEAGQLASVPLRDSVMAIADESYFDWPVLPEAPSSLVAKAAGGSVTLKWEVHGGSPAGATVERRSGTGAWEQVAKIPKAGDSWRDDKAPAGQLLSYRVRAVNAAGQSAYSNIVRVRTEGP
ncbi:MAG TPA: fibronectin type III domain-containing protein, partial [Terriglobia bacterium]|nr:fibronectin type III domain-containing protein [Terriglobia bacterium]